MTDPDRVIGYLVPGLDGRPEWVRDIIDVPKRTGGMVPGSLLICIEDERSEHVCQAGGNPDPGVMPS